ncbi:hypothetical protein HK097_009947 [Rhizophlyctis rosea]|uniref:Uncharacterized protein n=1 Tax=Rhizophlyctis rosea TaxID=64517 RepID=A0AAD5SHM5_9FUNG|nr:hypothetical protein HK097_009947 [Rhizophlyctis rosea]
MVSIVPDFRLPVLLQVSCLNSLTKTFSPTELNITNNAVSPDCGPTVPALLVNGRFNGPTLEANVGEIIEVTVHNKLFSEGTSIHWHGLHLRDAPYYDGAGKITQDLIPPGKSFTYRIPTGEQSGTYFYHAHHALQSQQIHGALIIRDPKTDSQLPHYDEERILEFSDHWHKDSTTQLVGLVANPTFTWIGDAQSLLINGKGPFNGTCATGNSQNWTTIEVEQGKTYRLRLIGSSTLGYFNFEIPNHNLTIVEADGIPVKPYTVSRLEINSGQRYSVLLKADQPPSVYWASLRILWRPAGPTGFALLKYKNAPNDVVTSAQPSFVSPPSKPAESIEWILPKLEPLKGHGKTVPKKADREIVLESTQFTNYTYEGSDTRYVRWIVNNVSFTFPPRPTYFHALEGSLDKLPVTSKPYHIKHNEVVDFIFQAVTSAGGVCEAHPWHIHGNYFYEIESGPGKYDPKLTTPASNATHFENPLPRDSITVFPYQV